MKELTVFIDHKGATKTLSLPDVCSNFKSCQISKDIVIYLDGYISDSGTLEGAHEHGFIKALYFSSLKEKRHEDIACLNGHYNILILDKSTSSVMVVTDRFALRPIYWAPASGGVVLSTSVKRISEFHGVNFEINQQAMIEFIKFGFVLNGATFFKYIHRFDSASINTFVHGEGWATESYASWSVVNDINCNSVAENTEIVFNLLQNAVKRTLKGVVSPAVTISGGLDSRVLAGMITEIKGAPPTFFHCSLSEKETKGSRAIVEALKGELQALPLTPADERILSTPVETGDGCTALNQFWLLGLFKNRIASSGSDCVFNGFYLDTLLNPSHSFMHYGKLNVKRVTSDRQRRILIDRIYGLPEGYYCQYFSDSAIRNLNARALDEVERLVGGIETHQPDQFCRLMNLKTRADRYVLPLANTCQKYCDIRFPGIDYDLIDFCMTLPSRHFNASSLYLKLFETFYPALFRAVWSRTGRPLHEGLVSHGRKETKFAGLLGLSMRRLSMGLLDFHTPRNDLNYLFRKKVKFREEVLGLFSPCFCLSHGLVGKKGLNRLIRNILTGKNDFFILERLMVIELFFRRFIVGAG